MSTLSATPGRGPICRVEINANAILPAQLVPHRTHVSCLDPEVEPADVQVVRKVDVVIPHGRREYATGAVLTVRDADTARDIAALFTRAADMLAQTAHPAAVKTVELPPESLRDITDLTPYDEPTAPTA